MLSKQVKNEKCTLHKPKNITLFIATSSQITSWFKLIPPYGPYHLPYRLQFGAAILQSHNLFTQLLYHGTFDCQYHSVCFCQWPARICPIALQQPGVPHLHHHISSMQKLTLGCLQRLQSSPPKEEVDQSRRAGQWSTRSLLQVHYPCPFPWL